MKRKIAAIVAADVADYSRLVREDEEDTLSRLIEALAFFKSSVARHNGRIFNTAGDAILAEFASPVEAVRAAVDVQQHMRDVNTMQLKARELAFRIGISIGDVVEHGEDLLGDGVNIAARLQTIASPGGIAISHWVQEQIVGKIAVPFRDAGLHTVKNITKPVHVFLVDMPVDRKTPSNTTQSSEAPVERFGARLRGARPSTRTLWGLAGVVGIALVFAVSSPAPKLGSDTVTPSALAPIDISATDSKAKPGSASTLIGGKKAHLPLPSANLLLIPATALKVLAGAAEVVVVQPSPPTVIESHEVALLPQEMQPSTPVRDPNLGSKLYPLPNSSTTVQEHIDPILTRKQRAALCQDIAERAQLGDLSATERNQLRFHCH